MKAKKSLLLFLVSCLILSLTFCLGIAAEDGAEEGGIETITLVSLIVGGVVLVAAVVLCIIKREKLVKALRDYRGEMKHITWFPWKSVWRCSVLVIVVCLITAALVGLLDIAFFEAQYALTGQGFSFFK